MNTESLNKFRDLVVIALGRVVEQQNRLTSLSAEVLALQGAVRDTPLMKKYLANKRVLRGVHNDLAIPDSDDALTALIQQLKDLKF
jgi:hypothetical protein